MKFNFYKRKTDEEKKEIAKKRRNIYESKRSSGDFGSEYKTSKVSFAGFDVETSSRMSVESKAAERTRASAKNSDQDRKVTSIRDESGKVSKNNNLSKGLEGKSSRPRRPIGF